MQKLSDSLTNMAVVLTLIAVITGGILAYVNHMTEEPIANVEKQALEEGIKSVMNDPDVVVAQTIDTTMKLPGAEKESDFTIYSINNAEGEKAGVAVSSTTTAFGGDLQVLVGFDNEDNILGYSILKTTETPGLGAKADKWFQKGEKGDIIGKNPNDEAFKVSKDGGEIDAITASTITSRAFLLAVKNGYLAYKTACEPKGPVVSATTEATKSTPEKETQEKDIKTPKSK